MTIGVTAVRTNAAYWREVARINRDYLRRTGIRMSVAQPRVFAICNLCHRVQAECVCGVATQREVT